MIMIAILILASGLVSILASASGLDCENPVKLTTFNAGLTPHLPGYESRREVLPLALPQHDADVICLQEMWFEDDMKRLVDRMIRRGFSFYSTINEDVDKLKTLPSFLARVFTRASSPPCATWRVSPLMLCYIWNCRRTSKLSLLMCLEQNCRTYLNIIPQDCISCLVMGLSGVKTVLNRCMSGRQYNRFNTQGLMIFSRKRILKASHQVFQDERIRQILPRGYIEAEIENLGTIVCTHFTVNISRNPIEDNLPYNTTGSQQADEIRRLHEHFKHKEHIILGDLNTGPYDPSRNLWTNLPENYQLLKDFGYISPYEMNGGTCTYCDYNNVQNNASKNSLVDHILLERQSFRNPKRVFTRRVGKWNLSDHFGLQIEVCV
ncbi:hypothetical protein LOTGIDRAFT_236514 [Lottia gigantea]|uniref:Endonuclease/exonuclease/phosphatase domain-containing protein n=1 Tax=Lottia gigantea TaxID=225164 RepID=V3ZS12_LOTGI|nr:hypothetical protein LOTGIDRAFT_236514 [Lottia gigantea]ESO83681.1 hypothetical protein LOTGIDRAFT_236514 [Lottia gigantea]